MRSAGVLLPSGASFMVVETQNFSVKIWLRHKILKLCYRNATQMPWLVTKVRPRDPSCVAWYTHMDALCWYVSVSTTRKKSWWTHWVPWESLGFILCKTYMRQKNGFDRYPEFKSKGVEFEVRDKYLFRQLTDLLIRQSCQACSSKPLAKEYHENKSKDQVEDLKIRRSRRVDQVEDLKIRDSTRICNSGRISGATDKGIVNRSR
jgi:hypothetical protein